MSVDGEAGGGKLANDTDQPALRARVRELEETVKRLQADNEKQVREAVRTSS